MNEKFIDISNENIVEAIQCGHDGFLGNDNFDAFNQGDWIVILPLNIIGNIDRIVVKENEFNKKYRSISSKVKSSIDWASMGWKV